MDREKLKQLSDALHNPLILPDWEMDMAYYGGCVVGFARKIGLIDKSDLMTSTLPFGTRERAWVVGWDWSRIDNTRWGAALRIDYLLENGVPKDFNPEYIETYTTLYK